MNPTMSRGQTMSVPSETDQDICETMSIPPDSEHGGVGCQPRQAPWRMTLIQWAARIYPVVVLIAMICILYLVIKRNEEMATGSARSVRQDQLYEYESEVRFGPGVQNSGVPRFRMVQNSLGRMVMYPHQHCDGMSDVYPCSQGCCSVCDVLPPLPDAELNAELPWCNATLRQCCAVESSSPLGPMGGPTGMASDGKATQLRPTAPRLQALLADRRFRSGILPRGKQPARSKLLLTRSRAEGAVYAWPCRDRYARARPGVRTPMCCRPYGAA